MFVSSINHLITDRRKASAVNSHIKSHNYCSMKNIIGLILLFLISCQVKQEPHSIVYNSRPEQLHKSITNQDGLFLLQVNSKENFVSITPPENSDFELPDSSAKIEPFKYGDFNADGRGDILVYLAACGTGGCVYGLFLNQYERFYKLAYFDYLKNTEFKVEENGFWTIESSEELEPYNPSRIQITSFKYNKNSNQYELDTSYVHSDK